MASGIRCPNCSALLSPPADGDARSLKCDYCGREVLLDTMLQPKGDRPHGVRSAPPHPAPARNVKALVILPLAAAVLVSAIVVYVAARKAQQARQAGATTTPSGAEASAPQERVRWADGEQPHAVDINGDGIEDLILVGWVFGDETLIHVFALDGKSFDELWRLGDFGDIKHDSAQMYTHVVVAGEHVLVSDHRSMLQIFALGSGEKQREVRLSDRMTGGCGDPDDPQRAWLSLTDDMHVMVDLGTGEVELAPRPAWCPGPLEGWLCYHQSYHRQRLGHAQCLEVDRAQKSDGFAVDYLLANGDYVVGVGHKDPGTPLPMIAGYEKGTEEQATARKKRKRGETASFRATWVQNLAGGQGSGVKEWAPALSDLVDDALLVQYGMKDQFRLTAISASDGATRWDVEVPDSHWPAEMMLVSDTRIYLLVNGALAVFDRDTGKLDAYRKQI